MSERDDADVIILGAGMSGLAAAGLLRQHGRCVRLLDKGVGVGGRMATRRIGDAVLDHGAQFFTTRGDGFGAHVADGIDSLAVAEWCRGFGTVDGYPRYRGRGGMTSVAEWMAEGHDIELGVTVDRIVANADADGIEFVDDRGRVVARAADAIVTAPIPQMVTLLDRGNIAVQDPLNGALRSTHYFATLALLVVLDGAGRVDEPGGMQFDDGPFTFIADNRRKGISSVPALTFHAEHDYSAERFGDAASGVITELLDRAAPWIGSADIIDVELHRWRHAGPKQPLPNRCETIRPLESSTTRIMLAGDAFGGPKVEGAFNSGIAAATALVAS